LGGREEGFGEREKNGRNGDGFLGWRIHWVFTWVFFLLDDVAIFLALIKEIEAIN
jgi:hypothetical protein